MSKLIAALGPNAAPILGAGVFAIGTLGAGAYFGLLSPDAPVPQEVTQPNVETSVIAAPAVKTAIDPKPVVVVEATPEVQEATPEVQTDLGPSVIEDAVEEIDEETIADVLTSPSIDEVRSEADGLTILAGRGEPGGNITLFVDNFKNTSVDIGTDGAFAIVAFLDPSPNAKTLSIVQRVGDIELAAADIILAPQLVAEVVAEAEVEVETPRPVTPENVTPTPEDVTPEDVASAPADPIDPGNPIAMPAPTTEVAILKSDEDGVEIINRSSAPEVMSNVEIDTISYSEEGDVLLSGRAQSEATSVRVYLNNAPVTTLDVDTSGRWRGDLPDVDTGVYTLRVDEVDTAGAVTSRVETPFKRESPEVLAAAESTIDAPAKAITVQTGATLWAIARDRYGDGMLFVRVFEANSDSIKDANLIYPGQVFELPE